MPARHSASRVLVCLVLITAPTLTACGQTHSGLRPGPAGTIEALREKQEAAQQSIEAEGRRQARQAKAQQQAIRTEAEREADDRPANVR